MVQYATVPGSNPGTFAKAGNYSVSVMGTANNVAYIQVRAHLILPCLTSTGSAAAYS
jgi:hypothetical protein